jgi:2-iminobutanoate/2-iminopropanoate deaminase
MKTKKRIDDPDAAPNTGSYSPALRVGPWLFVSGQGPIDANGEIVAGDIIEQTKLTMENIRRLVERGGGRMDDIVKCTCHLQNIADFDAFDAVYRSYFSEPLPTRTTVQSGLAGIAVEIDAMAYVDLAPPLEPTR